MQLTDIRRTISNIRSSLERNAKIDREIAITLLEAASNLTRILEQYLCGKEYQRYLLRDTKAALSLAEKLTKSQPGEFVHLTAEEFKHAENIIKV